MCYILLYKQTIYINIEYLYNNILYLYFKYTKISIINYLQSKNFIDKSFDPDTNIYDLSSTAKQLINFS